MAKINNNGIGGKITISYELIQQKGRTKINIDDNVFYSSGRAAVYSIIKDVEY